MSASKRSHLLIPASPNPNTDQVQVDQAGRRISLYTSGRVGFEGQYPNWAIFGRDVPYIYTEIIFGLDADGRDTQNEIRLSVDKVWSQNGPGSGLHYFNEVRIYSRKPRLENLPFILEGVYPIGSNAQMLRPFIFSVPEGQWPTEITVPTVPNPP